MNLKELMAEMSEGFKNNGVVYITYSHKSMQKVTYCRATASNAHAKLVADTYKRNFLLRGKPMCIIRVKEWKNVKQS